MKELAIICIMKSKVNGYCKENKKIKIGQVAGYAINALLIADSKKFHLRGTS